MFDPFKGFVGGDSGTPTPEDVARRQQLAKTILDSQIEAKNPLGVLANFLGGAASGYENSAAADENARGRGGATDALAKALSGGDINAPELMTAAGTGFMTPDQSDIATALMKRKYGLGETFFGTPQVSFDDATDPKHEHPFYSIIGSLGTVKPIKPPTGAGSEFSIKNQLVDTPQAAGVAVNPYSGNQTSGGVMKQNAQAEFEKAYGDATGKTWAEAPAQLKGETNLLQNMQTQHESVSNTIDEAIAKVDNWTSGTLGAFLSGVPGTPGYDLKSKLVTIGANTAFDKLQQIRALSPTGGALGQVSNMEEQMLRDSIASLDQAQSADQLKKNLMTVKMLIKTIDEQAATALKQDLTRFDAPPPSPPTLGPAQTPTQGAPQTGAPNDPLGLRGGQ